MQAGNMNEFFSTQGEIHPLSKRTSQATTVYSQMLRLSQFFRNRKGPGQYQESN